MYRLICLASWWQDGELDLQEAGNSKGMGGLLHRMYEAVCRAVCCAWSFGASLGKETRCKLQRLFCKQAQENGLPEDHSPSPEGSASRARMLAMERAYWGKALAVREAGSTNSLQRFQEPSERF